VRIDEIIGNDDEVEADVIFWLKQISKIYNQYYNTISPDDELEKLLDGLKIRLKNIISL